jgi:serine/threonine protein kinase
VDPETGLSVAVKQMHIDDGDSEAAAQMEKEISFLKTMSHPNLVRYIGTRRVNNKLNIVLEFCTEGSITSMLRMYKRFPDRLIRLYTKQMVDALIYLHAHDIVHRDIKGGNVLVHGEGARAIVKLSDFGCSKKLGSSKALEKSSKMKGTVLWMAPEAALQSPDTGTPSDIWSLGATVIEMATGKPPWTEDGLVDEIPALIHIATTRTPPSFPEDHLSSSGLEFLRNCMEVDAKRRWSAKQLALHDFLVIEQTATVSTAEVGRKPEIVGASSFNALRAAVKGRDLLQEREQLIKIRMKKAMEQIMKLVIAPGSGDPDWRKIFTRDIELSLPSVSVRLVGMPCVFSVGQAPGELKIQGLVAVTNALQAARREEKGATSFHFVASDIRNTRELIQVESRTAMWKWETRGTFPFAEDQLRIASGSAMATFDVSGQLIKTLEFVWDATGFMEKVALLSPSGSASADSRRASSIESENRASGGGAAPAQSLTDERAPLASLIA